MASQLQNTSRQGHPVKVQAARGKHSCTSASAVVRPAPAVLLSAPVGARVTHKTQFAEKQWRANYKILLGKDTP